MPAPARTASNEVLNWPAVADEEPDGGSAVVDVHQQVAGLLGGPGSSRMAGCPEDVHVAASHLEGEEHVDPLQCQSTGRGLFPDIAPLYRLHIICGYTRI